jgi:hypothetical protein
VPLLDLLLRKPHGLQTTTTKFAEAWVMRAGRR